MAKKIQGKYYVADCEHYGDMQRAKIYLRELSCIIIESYWDGRDCGDAWIRFSFDESRFKEMYEKLHDSAMFNADINDYLPSKVMDGYTKMNARELEELHKQMCQDTSRGFLDRMPLRLFFEVKENSNPKEITDKCLSFLKHPYKVLGYYFKVTDGCNYCTILMSSSYKNLSEHTIGDGGIGDFCLGNSGWLNHHHIYGECSCHHKLYDTMFLGGYGYFHRVVKRMMERKTLEYRGGTYYNSIDIKVGANEYFNADGSFNIKLTRNGKEYTIKDPRHWDWSEF